MWRLGLPGSSHRRSVLRCRGLIGCLLCLLLALGPQSLGGHALLVLLPRLKGVDDGGYRDSIVGNGGVLHVGGGHDRLQRLCFRICLGAHARACFHGLHHHLVGDGRHLLKHGVHLAVVKSIRHLAPQVHAIIVGHRPKQRIVVDDGLGS